MSENYFAKTGRLQVVLNVHADDCGSAHCSGCVVDGISVKTACLVQFMYRCGSNSHN